MIETWSDVRDLTDTLRRLADWQADLQTRIDRCSLCAELIGLSRERQDALLCEGEAFKRCCRALAASISERAAA